MNLAQLTGIVPLAQTATTQGGSGSAPADGQKQPPPGWTQWLPLILILVLMYFFVFRNKSKQEKQRVQMLNTLKKGDRIQTIGGILGTVIESRENEVVVKVDETANVKITFSRSAIHRVVEEEKK